MTWRKSGTTLSTITSGLRPETSRLARFSEHLLSVFEGRGDGVRGEGGGGHVTHSPSLVPRVPDQSSVLAPSSLVPLTTDHALQRSRWLKSCRKTARVQHSSTDSVCMWVCANVRAYVCVVLVLFFFLLFALFYCRCCLARLLFLRLLRLLFLLFLSYFHSHFFNTWNTGAQGS